MHNQEINFIYHFEKHQASPIRYQVSNLGKKQLCLDNSFLDQTKLAYIVLLKIKHINKSTNHTGFPDQKPYITTLFSCLCVAATKTMQQTMYFSLQAFIIFYVILDYWIWIKAYINSEELLSLLQELKTNVLFTNICVFIFSLS